MLGCVKIGGHVEMMESSRRKEAQAHFRIGECLLTAALPFSCLRLTACCCCLLSSCFLPRSQRIKSGNSVSQDYRGPSLIMVSGDGMGRIMYSTFSATTLPLHLHCLPLCFPLLFLCLPATHLFSPCLSFSTTTSPSCLSHCLLPLL